MNCPNVKECICPKIACPNHGRCCACVIKHRTTDSLPYCLFPDNGGDKSNRNHYEVLKKRFKGVKSETEALNMSGFAKKKEETKAPACACGVCPTGEATEIKAARACCGKAVDGVNSVKVLGVGCKSCREQYENVKQALDNMGLTVDAAYITDMEKVMAYGVMTMPALVVNEQVVSAGRVLKAADVERLLRKLGF